MGQEIEWVRINSLICLEANEARSQVVRPALWCEDITGNCSICPSITLKCDEKRRSVTP